jgi:beta-lactamase superfamily II metal-dependent hydrolase
MFRVTMLPAQQGDALWIEYGSSHPPHRILIDAGTAPTAEVVRKRILDLREDERSFELWIVTHIDTDHIAGALKLLSVPPQGFTVGDTWFNERRHLVNQPESKLGAVDGEILGGFLDSLQWPWNEKFAHGQVAVPDSEAAPPCFKLPGGMELTLLSPGPTQIDKLRRAWLKELEQKNLNPAGLDYVEQLSELMHKRGVHLPSLLGDEEQATVNELADQLFHEDDSPANASTIAVLAEYDGRSCLLTGDAVPSVLVSCIKRLLRARRQPKLRVDAVKLPHHGSRNNVSDEFLETLVSPRWLFSTNGNRYHHPDPAAVARVIRSIEGQNAALCFNYPKEANPMAARWADSDLELEWGYRTQWARDQTSGWSADLAS